AAGSYRGARAVERPVAEHETLDPLRAGHGRLQVADRHQQRAEVAGRVGIQRVLLALGGTSLAGVGPAGEALGEEAPSAGLPRGRQKVVGALAPKPVGEREVAGDLARVD